MGAQKSVFRLTLQYSVFFCELCFFFLRDINLASLRARPIDSMSAREIFHARRMYLSSCFSLFSGFQLLSMLSTGCIFECTETSRAAPFLIQCSRHFLSE